MRRRPYYSKRGGEVVAVDFDGDVIEVPFEEFIYSPQGRREAQEDFVNEIIPELEKWKKRLEELNARRHTGTDNEILEILKMREDHDYYFHLFVNCVVSDEKRESLWEEWRGPSKEEKRTLELALKYLAKRGA